jgi:hypothetical protein
MHISTQGAESCRSLQVRNRKGSATKADAQGISQIFCCANASNGSKEPSLPNFCNAANGYYQKRAKTFNNCLDFEQGLWQLQNM